MIHDAISHKLVVPNGTMGQRWEEGKQWNLKLETEDGSKMIQLYLLQKKNMSYKPFNSLTLIVKETVFSNDLSQLKS